VSATPPDLQIETPRGCVRLIVATAATRRQRPRRDPQGNEEIRLSSAEVEQLIR